jgi:fatty-acyl-CoA synthase
MTLDRGTAPSYAHGLSDVSLVGRTIGEDLERTVERFADREALVSSHQGLKYTYGQLDDAVNRLACGLLASGVGKGDRVGIWAPNCAEWIVVQYATAKVGAVLVNINPAYRTHELAYALRQSGVRLLISAPSFKTGDYVAMVDEVRHEAPTLEHVVYLDSPEWEALAIADLDREALTARMTQLDFDDPINIQYTSGTTGFPKGATLSHHNILNNGYFVARLLGYSETDRVCVPVPFYHCFGMVIGNLCCTTHGACIVTPAPSVRRRGDPASGSRGALYVAVRGTDDVYRHA